MKRSKELVWVFALVLFAAPVFAQDEGGGGLPSSLFTGGDFGGNRGGGQANPIEAIKRFFAQAKVTFSGDQERALKPIVENAFKQVQDTVERLNGQQPAAGGERRGGGGFDPGQRRGRAGPGGANAAGNPQLA